MSTYPEMRCQYFKEPMLEFAEGHTHIDPRHGISRHGPKSWKPQRRHPSTIRVGFVGSAETVDASRAWLDVNARGVTGNDKHLDFPGFMSDRGFYSQLLFDDDWIAQLNRRELEGVINTKSSRDRFEEALLLLQNRMALLARKDQAPEVVIVALPDDFYRKCRVTNYSDKLLGKVHRNLRRAFKATVMKHRLPTQLMQQKTSEGKKNDHPANIAWDFFSGIYAKAGGFAWGPTTLTPGTCYVGVSFYRPLGMAQSTVQTSIVQAFDEHGDGLVLRGQDFTWDPNKEGTRAPHLSADMAAELITLVLERYQREMGQRPRRVVVHKSSRYWPDEREGFEGVLRDKVEQYDLLALTPQNTIRLFPESKYPPLRGTRLRLGELDFLYTEGFIPELNRFFSLHVPTPLRIADHIGFDTPRDTLVREVLTLTKMNWNSARLGGLLPITLKFSQLVGDILKEIPADMDPLTNFKYYH